MVGFLKPTNLCNGQLTELKPTVLSSNISLRNQNINFLIMLASFFSVIAITGITYMIIFCLSKNRQVQNPKQKINYR